MIVYQISETKRNQNHLVPLNKSKHEVVTLELDNYNVADQVTDFDSFREKYGIDLSRQEIQIFAAHRAIWEMFLTTEDTHCLILEQNAEVKSFDMLDTDLNSISDWSWEVFFPFDKTEKIGINYGFHYLLGFYWGSCAYLLSRAGAVKLNNIKSIKQPVDDQILEMNANGELAIYCEPLDSIDIKFSNSFVHTGRLYETKKKVLSYNAWSKTEKLQVQYILRTISEISSKIKTPLMLHGGSLLGAIQHGGIIPWDDDVDLGIDKSNLSRFIDALTGETSLNFCKEIEVTTNAPFYKIWSNEGKQINEKQYKFPFVDIWLYSICGNDIVFENGIVFPDILPMGFNMKKFEGTEFLIPVEAIKCMNKMYGETWKYKFVIYPWCHKTESPIKKFFQTNILTNDEGAFIDYLIY